MEPANVVLHECGCQSSFRSLEVSDFSILTTNDCHIVDSGQSSIYNGQRFTIRDHPSMDLIQEE